MEARYLAREVVETAIGGFASLRPAQTYNGFAPQWTSICVKPPSIWGQFDRTGNSCADR